MAFVSLTGGYVERGLVRDPGSLPGPAWAAWAEAVAWHPAFGLLAFLLLLFPHGRLPSRRWRPFAWFMVAVYLTLSLSAALAPGAVELHYPEATPPVLGAGVLFPLFGLIPVSVAVAVFKYRLYEIDRLINRTLVYVLLTALLIGVYAGLVFLLGRLLDPATGDSALAVAALFQPASASLWLRPR